MEFIQKHFWKIYRLIVFVSMFLYLMLTGGKYVWADEAYSFALIRHSYSEVYRITAADVHPPLYFLVLKLLTQPFDYSLFAAKIVSIIPYMFIILFGGIQFKRLFDEKTAILFMLLFFLFPYMLLYSIEIRMYSFGAAFVFANAVYAYRCFAETGKLNWVLYVVFGLAAAYTHYFALVSVAIVYGLLMLMIIVKRRELIVTWLVCSIATIVLYLPWLKAFIGQFREVSNDYWIGEITLREVLGYVNSVFGSSGITGGKAIYGVTIYALIVLLTYLFAFIYVVASKEKSTILLCCCSLLVPAGTIAVGIAASLLVRPVFVIRYAIPAIPMLAVFMAIALGKMKNAALPACIFAVALLGGVSGYITDLQGEYNVTENAMDNSFVAEQNSAECYIVTILPERLAEHITISSILSYYETEKPVYCIASAGPEGTFANQVPLSEFDETKYNTVVLLTDVGELPDEEYASVYSYEYIGELVASGIGTDAYLLTK